MLFLLLLGIGESALPATTTLEVSEIEHALLDAARLQPWSHGFHWTLQKLAEEAISLHDGVGLGGTAPALLEEETFAWSSLGNSAVSRSMYVAQRPILSCMY